MKQPRETSKEIDLSTLLDPKELMSENPEDCFGKEWNPQDKDCSICHDVEICGIVKQQEIQGRKKKVEDTKGPMLDQTAFEKVPIEKIITNMKNWAADGAPSTYEELEESIMAVAQTKDKVAVREYIKRTLPRHGLTITEEKTIVPNESTDNHIISESPLTPEAPISGPGVQS